MLGERESTLLFACCVTRRARLGLALAAPLIGCASRCRLVLPGDAEAACESARHAFGDQPVGCVARLHGYTQRGDAARLVNNDHNLPYTCHGVVFRYKLPDDSLQDSLAAARSKAPDINVAAWFALHRD